MRRGKITVKNALTPDRWEKYSAKRIRTIIFCAMTVSKNHDVYSRNIMKRSWRRRNWFELSERMVKITSSWLSVLESIRKLLLFRAGVVFYVGDSANAVPRYQKLRSRVTHIWGNRKGQQHRSAMVSLALEEPPSWSRYPLCQVSMIGFD